MSIRDVVERLATEGISIHPDHLRNVELGRKQPSERLLGGIARALAVPKAALIGPVPADVA